MKAVAALVGLCLLGLVSADFAWNQGQQYRYKVRGRVMAGISEIDTQYSGLQLEYVQLMTVTGQGVINVKTEQLKVIETNDELTNGGWRDGQIRKGQEASIPQELKHYLTCPMDLIIKKGVVEAIKVPSDLPTWAVNIKKAMASTFILDTTGSNAIVRGNLNRQSNAVTVEEANQESGFFYQTLETSVHGECEVYYTVSQNGPFDAPYPIEKEAQAGQGSQSGSSESQEQRQGKRQHQNQLYKKYQQYANSGSSSSSESSEESSKEQAWPKAFNNLCQQGDQIYEIIKTVNFTACAQKPVLAYSTPAELNFRPADNAGGSLWSRALVSRYLACGTSRQNYTILKITQQERFHTGLRQHEKVVAGAQKNVTLISIGHGQPTQVNNPKTINNLVYTFDPKEQELMKEGRLHTAAQMNSGSSSSESREMQQDSAYMGQRQNRQRSSSEESSRFGRQQQNQYQKAAYKTSAEGKGQLPQPALDQAPLSSMLITPLKREQMKERVHELMKEIAQDLTKSTEKDSIAEREVLSKISTVVKVLRVLNSQGIKEVAQRWTQSGDEKQIVARKIFLDALSICGTNPAVVFLLEHIKAGHINGEEAAQILATLPMYIRTPTRELLEQYAELFDNESVKRQTQVRTTAMLSFSTLVFNACINKRVKNTRFPVALYGEFCNEQYVAKKFVPYFIQHLEKRLEAKEGQENKHWIITLLQVLGNIGHPDTIEVVQKIMDQETDVLIKSQAIYALKNLIQSRQTLNQGSQQQRTVLPVDRQSRDILTDEIVEKQVLPILVSVAFDKGEHPEVRNAAYALLFHCTYADVALWQQAALATWFEPSRDVRSFVFSTLKSLAQLDRPLKGIKWAMQLKARAVLSMAKPIDASIARSHNLFTSQFVEEVSTGFAQHLSYFQSQDSIVPSQVYYKNFFQFGNGAAGVHPIEFSVAGNTIQKLASVFMNAVTGEQQKGQSQEHHQDLSQIKNLLNIQPREQDKEEIQGKIYLKLRDEIERLWTFDEQTIEQLAQQLAQAANSQGELNVNYQKAVHMAEHLAAMPTIMGFPLVYKMSMPALISIRGTIKLDNKQGGYSLQADLSPVYAWKIHRQLAFKVPFTGKKYQAGVQRHVVVEVPFSAVARKAPQGQLQLAITPAHLSAGSPSGTINLITYHQIPYTAIITDEFYPTNHKQGGQMKIVHANQDKSQDYENQKTFGQDALGLSFQVQEKSEFPEEQENISGWTRFIRRFHSANCAFNAAWLGSPSIRFVKRQFNLDLDKSETKTLVFMLAARNQRSSVARDLQSSEESSMSGSQEQNRQRSQSSSESSSSSESAEGQQWFAHVRSPAARQQVQKQQQKSERTQQKTRTQQYGRQSGSQSGSSSSESAEFSQQGKQPQRGFVVVLALLGKKAPLESLNELKSSVQKPLQNSATTTVQYLAQLNLNRQGKLFSRVAMGEAVKSAAQDLPSTSRAFQGIREAIVEAQNSKNQAKACVELQLTIDTPKHASRHIVAIRAESLLAQDLSVKVQGKLQAGQSCRMMPLTVQIQGKFRRDQEMTQWAQSKSPEAKKCNQDKKKGFTVSQICMDVSEQQAAALNQFQITFQHSAMPEQIRNFTVYHVQNFLKAALYPYMSENQFPESAPAQKGTFEIWGRMTPNKQFVSFHIRKPDSVLTFNDIKTGPVLKALLPLTATQTPYGNIKDRLFRSQSDSMCALEKNYVNTFDNVTYSFNQQAARGCQHVLAKDCSGRYPMAVLVKDLQQDSGRAVTVILGAHKIKIVPQQSQQSQQKQAGAQGMTVLIDGHQQSLPAFIRSQNQYNRQPIAEVMAMPNGGVQIIGRHIQVATDGKRVIVYGSNELRNRTCGICGDFNNEKVADMRSPKDFPLSSGSLLVASYSFKPLDGSSQCQIEQQLQRQVRKEEQNGEQESRHVPKIYQRGQQYAAQQQQRYAAQKTARQQQQQYQKIQMKQRYNKYQQSSSEESQESMISSERQYRQQQKEQKRMRNQNQKSIFGRRQSQENMMSSSSEEVQPWGQQQNQGQNMHFKQQLVRDQKTGKKCLTVNKLPACAEGYRPMKMQQKKAMVYCMDSQSQIQNYKSQIEQGQMIDVSRHATNKRMNVQVPQKCVRV
jgi:hypothetical protein